MTQREALIEARSEELLTVKEFAAITRRNEQTIYRRIWSGRQQGALRDGGQWKIDVCVAFGSGKKQNA